MAFFVFLMATMRRFRSYLRDPEFRGLFYSVIVLLIGGMFVFHYLEGWSYLDALYFSLVSLTTVGYGDFSPETAAGKVWTMIYIVTGIGIISAFIAQLVTKSRERHRSNIANAKQQVMEAQDAVQKLITDLEQAQRAKAGAALSDLLAAQESLYKALKELPAQDEDQT